MTLTLEDVQNVRFPIAKRVGEGYRATEVDDFVDRVDATFSGMVEENQRLKAQLDALDGKSSGGSDLEAENKRLKAELEQARNNASQRQDAPVAAATTSAADDEELQRLRRENNDLKDQLEQARQSTPLTVMEGQGDGKGRVEKIVVTTAAQASPAVTRLVQLATEQAEAVVAEARDEAARTVEGANRQANEVTIDAQTRAERIQSEARVNADNLNSDVAKRRTELFSALETERDQLVGKIEGLRTFEQSYRNNMTKHFRSQLQTLEGARLEPANTPALVQQGRNDQGAAGSATPRLDALLSDQQGA